MGIVFKHEVTISEDFRDLLKRQRYERIVLTALNKSKDLICDLPLTAVEEQSNSECDFIDSKKRKYDEYYGSNVPLFRRNGYRQSGVRIP